jgi:hypothetical protein
MSEKDFLLYPPVDVVYESKEGRPANGLPSFKSGSFCIYKSGSFCIYGGHRQLAERVVRFLFLRQRLV